MVKILVPPPSPTQESTATHSLTLGQASPPNLASPPIVSGRHAFAPPAGSVDTKAPNPSHSRLRQKRSVGHVTLSKGPEPIGAEIDHEVDGPIGEREVTTHPALSTATQNPADGHEMPVRPPPISGQRRA